MDHSRLSNMSVQSENEDERKSQNFKQILKNNKEWAKKCIQQEPDYFTKLVSVQKPKYLWIGCSDSRVPANQIMGLKPGQVFVTRNVANIVSPSDINVLAVIQYAVEYLQVEDIIVAGHYHCGGVKAAFQAHDFGPLQSWLSHVRETRNKYKQALIGSVSDRQKILVQLNVKQQVINVAKVPAVQKAWRMPNRILNIHGLVYNLKDGILKDLGVKINSLELLPQEFRLTKIK